MNFITEQWLLVSLLSALIVALAVLESRKGGKALNFHEATHLLNQDLAIIVDVRDAKEYGAGHIVDALNIPHTKLQGRTSELEKYRSKTIIVADKMGQHAGTAGKVLADQGFTVTRLQGGMSEWVGQNLPVVKG